MATINYLFRILFWSFLFGGIGVDGHLLAQHNTTDNAAAIICIARSQLGIKEASGRNDGKEVSSYLSYVDMQEGLNWCAAFVSWCHGQAGYSAPRNAWSPALFPGKRLVKKGYYVQSDVFGIYIVSLKRIAHVGFLDQKEGSYWITIEGNSNNQVERRRRSEHTLARVSRWH